MHYNSFLLLLETTDRFVHSIGEPSSNFKFSLSFLQLCYPPLEGQEHAFILPQSHHSSVAGFMSRQGSVYFFAEAAKPRLKVGNQLLVMGDI